MPRTEDGRSYQGSSGTVAPSLSTRVDTKQDAVPRHGNYQGYYSMRRDARESEAGRSCRDRRATAIVAYLEASGPERDATRPRSTDKLLDIGCNAGVVALDLVEMMRDRPEFVVGVDLDKTLVSRARRAVKERGFLSNVPAVDTTDAAHQALGSGRYKERQTARSGPKKRVKIDEEKTVVRILHADWMVADVPDSTADGSISSPSDVQELARYDAGGYDVITALSVAKWIHIDHGDIGLRRFFARVVACLRPHGVFIIEVQPYKSYKHTLKVTAPESAARCNYYAMRILPDDFAWLLTTELGLEGPYTICESGRDGFTRSIHAYVQPASDKLSAQWRTRRERLLNAYASTDEGSGDGISLPWVPRHRDGFVY